MLYQIRDKDGVFVGDPLTTLEECEKKIAYEADMDHGDLFYITNADTGHVIDTYQICEHFECVDNISCENCLGYPNCPLHERLKIKPVTPQVDFATKQIVRLIARLESVNEQIVELESELEYQRENVVSIQKEIVHWENKRDFWQSEKEEG